MNLPSTITIFAGGPGSGCNPAVGRCGRVPKWATVEKYAKQASKTRVGFYSPIGQGSRAFGHHKSMIQVDESRLFKGTHSEDFVKKNNLMDSPLPTKILLKANQLFNEQVAPDLRRIIKFTGSSKKDVDEAKTWLKRGVRTLRDVFKVSSHEDLFYYSTQAMAADALRKKGYAGAIWENEDMYSPKQYQIWDDSAARSAPRGSFAESERIFRDPVR